MIHDPQGKRPAAHSLWGSFVASVANGVESMSMPSRLVGLVLIVPDSSSLPWLTFFNGSIASLQPDRGGYLPKSSSVDGIDASWSWCGITKPWHLSLIVSSAWLVQTNRQTQLYIFIHTYEYVCVYKYKYVHICICMWNTIY